MTPSTPQKLGRYEVLEEIGKGAMGVVYLARDPLIGRLVALKTFRVGFSAKDQELQQFRNRFVREAQSAGILSHPNIVTIHDVIDEGADGLCFIAMEYVKGTNLKQLLQRPDPFGQEFLIEVVSQIAEALDYAHSRGVVHRDIKPANILITPDDRVKITDFGIARLDTSNLTMEGQLLGTPNYMSPEQIQGKEVDHRADIFSLGVVFYEMLTRKKPFQGENLTAVTHKIVYEPFTPPEEIVKDLAKGMSSILRRCLEKDPNRRYPRAAEIAKDLRKIEAAESELEDTSTTQEVELEQKATTMIRRDEVLRGMPPPPAPPRTPTPSVVSTRPAMPVVTPEPPSAPKEAAPAVPASVTPVPARSPVPAARRRTILFAASGLAAVLVLALGALWLTEGASSSAPVAPAPSLEQQNRVTAATSLAEARTMLAQGNLQGALQAVARAELADPDSADARRLRAEIDLRSREMAASAQTDRRVADGMIAAREAMAKRRYDEALVAVARVLELRPDEPEAVELRAEAESARSRQRERARQALASSATPTAAPAPSTMAVPVPTPQASVPAPDAPANLRIDFQSDLSEGVLTIYAGERQILRESFRFVRKTGFLRSEKISGRIEAQRQLAPGTLALRAYVSSAGKPTRTATIDAEIRPGADHTLAVRVDEQGVTTVSFE
jgi:serine/threonine protein kinase